MTTASIGVAAYSVQNPKASQKYGQLAVLPVYQGAQDVLLRVSLAGIPAGATVTSAELRFTQTGAASGSHSMTLYRVTGAWPSSVTWATLPAFTSTGSVTPTAKSNPASGTVWSWTITSLVQSMVSGSNKNIGFLLAKNQTTRINLLGTTATAGKPVLVVTYTLAPATPSNLHPSSGSVSSAKPTLTFDADDDVISVNVQIDPAANPGTAFDSGEIPATAGLIDLTQTFVGGTYAGLSNGSTTSWRVRQKNDNGWSPWSSWAPFTRTNKSTVTIASPSSSAITDGTPPVVWTFSGTQTAWRVRLLDAAGKVLADSGRTVGTATSWTPPRGLITNGQTGTLQVMVWDDVDREATPGDPVYALAELAVTLTLSGSVTPVSSVAVSQSGPSPVVTITGTRASIPDEVRVFVNGNQVASYAGVDVFTGTNMTIEDLSAPMNLPATYRVAAVENGVVASGGSTVTYTPSCSGIWLFDESDHSAAAAFWGNAEQNESEPELSIVHTPITDGDDTVQVVRRRLVRYPKQGDIAARVLDTPGVDAATTEANLEAWKGYDAGHLFRLVKGNLNRTVIIGDLNTPERPENNKDQRVFDATFNWWSQVVKP